MALQSSPEIAAQNALISYLQTSLRLVDAFAFAEVIDAWPEPTTDLYLTDTRVVVAVSLGEPERTDYAANFRSGNAAEKRQRYSLGVVNCPITLGVWANSKELRKDADYQITRLLDAPYWSTILPVVNTTLVDAVAKAGLQWVRATSMADVCDGTTLRISDTENVVVDAIKHDRFRAKFKRTHAAGATVVEQKGRREHVEHTLHLRCEEHFDVVARFVFDFAKGMSVGAEMQRQEWQSSRNGVLWVPHVVDVAGATQENLTVQKTWTL